MARLNKQHDKLAELLSDMKFTNYKERSAQIAAFLEKYIPDVAAMETQMKKYEKFFKTADGKQKALEFIKQNQAPETIISAVVHLDEKSPHMHLCFVPLTEDKRLCAKEILGNKKKLTQWQDKYWEHMVKKYPDL